MPVFFRFLLSVVSTLPYPRKKAPELFMEMNCGDRFIHLSRLNKIVDSGCVSVSLDDTVPADEPVNLRVEKSSAKRAPRRNDEWETGAALTPPRTLAECEPRRRLE